MEKDYKKYSKFLRNMRVKHVDCVPPILIAGHQFTISSHHQDAVREYLKAYKLLPESPLIKLCVGNLLYTLSFFIFCIGCQFFPLLLLLVMQHLILFLCRNISD